MDERLSFLKFVMRISRQADYAIRVVLDLYLHPEARIKEIARRQSLSSSYVGRISQRLAKTGILDPKFHRWLLAAFNNRIQGDYDFFSIIDEDTVTEMIDQAREFLHAAQRHIENRE